MITCIQAKLEAFGMDLLKRQETDFHTLNQSDRVMKENSKVNPWHS